MVFVSLKHPSFTRLDCCWAVTHLTRRPCRADFGVATEVSKSYSRRRLQLSVERVCSTTQRLRAVEDNASAALLRCRRVAGARYPWSARTRHSGNPLGVTNGRCLEDGERQLRVEPSPSRERPETAHLARCRTTWRRSLHNPICRPSLWCIVGRDLRPGEPPEGKLDRAEGNEGG